MSTYDDSQRLAIDTTTNVVVTACPGSGKTTLIVGKIIREAYALGGTARAVLCLTFTRAAVRSINDKLRTSLGDSNLPGCLVSTIHGFVLNQIFKPYSALIGFERGLRLVSPTSIEYQNYANAVFDSRPTALEKLRYVRRGADGRPISNDLSAQKILEFWGLLEEGGLIDFPSLLYYGYQLIDQHKWIAQGISARYQWIIVDEYQDTSTLALAILNEFRTAARSQFMLVGDPRQRIYSFAGVEIKQLQTFAESLEPVRYSLTGSYRCGAAICSDGSRLISKPSIFTSNRAVDDDASTTEFVRSHSTLKAITDQFLPRLLAMNIPFRNSAILGPATKALAALGTSLRDAGIAVTGAPTRSYNESSISSFSEAAAAFARRSTPRNHRLLQDTFNQIFNDTEDEEFFENYYLEARCTFDTVCAKVFRADASVIVDQLDEVFETVSIFAELLGQSMADLVRERWMSLRKDLEIIPDPCATLAEQVDTLHSLTLSTIHGAKGLEYRGVALIQLNEGILPHAYSVSLADLSEDRRKLFVGLTRAMDYVLYISDREDARNRVSRFVGQLNFT